MVYPATQIAPDSTASSVLRSDNKPGGIKELLARNSYFRSNPWPEPYNTTNHSVHLADARNLSWIKTESVHLVVTSPPYFTLKKYEPNTNQLAEILDYESFLNELDKVWSECARVLVPGGRICCVVGDVCISRRAAGRHYILPLHADLQVRARKQALDCLTPILWQKIANGATEVQGNGAGFYGKPYQPGAIVKNDVEHILFFRKGGHYRSPELMQKILSMLTKEEMQGWLVTAWTDIKGESTKSGHPAPYPEVLAQRLIRLFSFAGDTVLDPFLGTGTTSIAAMNTGRNSIGVEVEKKYFRMSEKRLHQAASQGRMTGPIRSNLEFTL
jgi:site-specific DNA-methyltransferase (adenine-specific)